MAWWTNKLKKEEVLEEYQRSPVIGQMIPTNDPKGYADALQKVLPAPDPEPDLSTKPPDKVGYCFGFVCPKKHVSNTFESITADGYKNRKVCPVCGAVSQPATVKRTAEAQWGDCSSPSMWEPQTPEWRWFNSYVPGFGKTLDIGDIIWTNREFLQFLDEPKPRPRRKKK